MRTRNQNYLIFQDEGQQTAEIIKTEIQTEIQTEIKTEIKSEIKSEIKIDKKRKRGKSGGGRKVQHIQLETETEDSQAIIAPAVIKCPKNWQQVFELIRAYREVHKTAVDSQGCHMLARSVDPKIKRYQILMSLQLSSQTKDEVNAQAMKNLTDHCGGEGLNCDTIISMDPKVLDNLIGKVGFHNRKTIYLQQTAQILKDKYDGDIPDNIEGLLELPGIGPKMGYLALQIAWDKNEGIGVDIHVHRISNRLGWVKATKTPEQTRAQLESWLPREDWKEINHMLVGFGQSKCTPLRPDCSTCPVKTLCPKIGATKTKKQLE